MTNMVIQFGLELPGTSRCPLPFRVQIDSLKCGKGSILGSGQETQKEIEPK